MWLFIIMTTNNLDYFQIIPAEAFHLICSYIPAQDVPVMEVVNHSFNLQIPKIIYTNEYKKFNNIIDHILKYIPAYIQEDKEKTKLRKFFNGIKTLILSENQKTKVITSLFKSQRKKIEETLSSHFSSEQICEIYQDILTPVRTDEKAMPFYLEYIFPVSELHVRRKALEVESYSEKTDKLWKIAQQYADYNQFDIAIDTIHKMHFSEIPTHSKLDFIKELAQMAEKCNNDHQFKGIYQLIRDMPLHGTLGASRIELILDFIRMAERYNNNRFEIVYQEIECIPLHSTFNCTRFDLLENLIQIAEECHNIKRFEVICHTINTIPIHDILKNDVSVLRQKLSQIAEKYNISL